MNWHWKPHSCCVIKKIATNTEKLCKKCPSKTAIEEAHVAGHSQRLLHAAQLLLQGRDLCRLLRQKAGGNSARVSHAEVRVSVDIGAEAALLA